MGRIRTLAAVSSWPGKIPSPHLEERARSARVSKDGRRRARSTLPSFETPVLRTGSAGRGCELWPAAQEIRRRRRSPDVGRLEAWFPHFRALRVVAVPRARIEITELLVLHLVELAEQLHHLVV